MWRDIMTGQENKWIVWNPAKSFPKTIHHNEQDAVKECKRIATLEQTEVFVYKCVGSFKLSAPPVEWVPATYDEVD